MFTKMILIMFIALCWFNNIYSNYVKSVKSVNSIDKIKDRLYMCNTYCFTYAENKISLDNYLCNNIYASSCHDLGWNSGKFIINNVSAIIYMLCRSVQKNINILTRLILKNFVMQLILIVMCIVIHMNYIVL